MALAAGKPRTAFADRRVQALWQAFDDFQHTRRARGLQHLGVGGVGFADADVVGDAALEQVGVLEYLADLRRQLPGGHLPHVHAAYLEAALGDIEEACDQPHQGGLAGAGGTDQRRHAAWGDLQADLTQYLRLIVGIAEAYAVQLDPGMAWRGRVLRLWQWLDREQLAQHPQLAARAAQHLAVAGHFQQRVDEAADQQQRQDHRNQRAGRQAGAPQLAQPCHAADHQGGERGLHGPGVEHHRHCRNMDQTLGRLLLAGDGLFEKTCAAVGAVEGAQHRLGLGELDHALAGLCGVGVEAFVGALAEAGGEREQAEQQGQGDQGDQAHLQVQDQLRHHHHERRDHTRDQRGEDVGRQLRHGHHALRGDMVQARVVVGVEPAHRQLRDVVAEAMPATLEHGDADPDASLFDHTAQRPAHQRSDQQHAQPTRCTRHVACQQVAEYRQHAEDGQPAQQAVDQRLDEIAMQHQGVIAEQFDQGLQHGACSCSLACW